MCSLCNNRTLRLRVTRGNATEFLPDGKCDDCGVLVSGRRVVPPGREAGQMALFNFDSTGVES